MSQQAIALAYSNNIEVSVILPARCNADDLYTDWVTDSDATIGEVLVADTVCVRTETLRGEY